MTTQPNAGAANDANRWLTPVNLPSMPVAAAPPDLSKWANPVDAVQRLLGDVLAYRAHAQQLEVQQQQMAHQAGLMHHKIDAAQKTALQTLDAQENLLASHQRAAFAELANVSRDRAQLIQAIVEISAALRTGNLDPEQTQACLTTQSILGGLFEASGEQSLKYLTHMSQHTQQAFEVMSGAHALLASR
jgi:hypothetical protein